MTRRLKNMMTKFHDRARDKAGAMPRISTHPALAQAYLREREIPYSDTSNTRDSSENSFTLDAERLLPRLRNAGY